MEVDLVNQLLCSTIKIDSRTKYYGNASIMEISILSMIYDLIDCYGDIEHDCLLKLNSIAQQMISKSPDICNFRGNTVFVQDNGKDTVNVIRLLNHAPTINTAAAGSMPDEGDDTYTFSEAEFKIDFTDADGDSPDQVKIVTLPGGGGTLQYNGTDIAAGFLFEIEDAANLTYVRVDNPYVDTFIFQTSDDNTTNKLFSNMATFTMTVNGQINQPPTIGDGSQTTAYATTIVFTRADFTTNTTPAYSDPEMDAADKLRVDSLPATGNLQLNAVNVTVSQEIDFTDIDAGLFTYVPDPGTTTTHMPSFTFSIADAGSGTFVS